MWLLANAQCAAECSVAIWLSPVGGNVANSGPTFSGPILICLPANGKGLRSESSRGSSMAERVKIMPKVNPGLGPFIGRKIYGPYPASDGRNLVIAIGPNRERKGMSYARYLACVKYDRMLTDSEDADHIDDNPLNDILDNIQVLTKLDNQKKSAKGLSTVKLICPKCLKVFVREKRQTHLVKGGNYTCCSRSCGATGKRTG